MQNIIHLVRMPQESIILALLLCIDLDSLICPSRDQSCSRLVKYRAEHDRFGFQRPGLRDVIQVLEWYAGSIVPEGAGTVITLLSASQYMRLIQQRTKALKLTSRKKYAFAVDT